MTRRIVHFTASLWLLATSLAPGAGWSLCFEASGRVAVELVAPAAAATGESGGVDCATDCPPDRCEECRDVSLATADRACPRREMVTDVAIALVAAETSPFEPVVSAPADWPRVCTAWASSSPHLVRVMRC